MGASGRKTHLRARHEALPRRGMVTPVGFSGTRHHLLGERGGLQDCQTVPSVLLSRHRRPPKKKRVRKTQEGGYSFDHVAWEMIKGLGKAGGKAARMGAGRAIRFDLEESHVVLVTNGG